MGKDFILNLPDQALVTLGFGLVNTGTETSDYLQFIIKVRNIFQSKYKIIKPFFPQLSAENCETTVEIYTYTHLKYLAYKQMIETSTEST